MSLHENGTVLSPLEATRLYCGLVEIYDGKHGKQLQANFNDLVDLLLMDAIRRYIHEVSTDPAALKRLEGGAVAVASKVPNEKYEALRDGLRKFLGIVT